MSSHLNAILTKPKLKTIATNTDSSYLETAHKSTQTEHLIALSPDEIIIFKDRLSIASCNKNLQIFVDTLNSKIVMSKPVLSTLPEPSTQIRLLNIQPSSTKGRQTKQPNREAENDQLIQMCSRKSTSPSLIVPQTDTAQLKVPEMCQP